MGFVLQLAAFYILVSVFSDGAESRARWQIFVISLVVTVLMSIVSRTVPTWPGFALACVLGAATSVAALIFWIKLTKRQALKITGAYIGFVIALSLVVTLVFGAIAR